MCLLAGTLGFAGFKAGFMVDFTVDFIVDFMVAGLTMADFDIGFMIAGLTEVGFINFTVEEDTIIFCIGICCLHIETIKKESNYYLEESSSFTFGQFLMIIGKIAAWN